MAANVFTGKGQGGPMRAQYVPADPLTEVEIGYLAGIIDGEGTIGIYKGREPYSYRLALIVTNTHRPMLEWLRSRIGGSLTRRGMRQKSHHKPAWQIVLWQARAAALIEVCRPF